MGLINAMFGNVSELDVKSLEKEYSEILCEGEQLEAGFVLIRDKWIFTSKRLIIQDTQGVTGKKREYLSIPYHSIEAFSVETTGTFDMDSEMKLWVKGMNGPLQQEFGRKVDIKGIQRLLASHVL